MNDFTSRSGNESLSSQSSCDKVQDNSLEEWKASREVLKGFDEKIHDLRKYGFTLVTALLTVNSFLLPSSIGGKDALTDQVKLAAIGSMMLLVVALRYGERTYRSFQSAASDRARIIENRLNFELTEKISSRYRQAYDMTHPDLVYFLFVVAIFGLGLAVVSQTLLLSLDGFFWLGVIAGISLGIISIAVMEAKSLREIRSKLEAVFVFHVAKKPAFKNDPMPFAGRAALFFQRTQSVLLWGLGVFVLGYDIWLLQTSYDLSHAGVLILSTLAFFLGLSSLAFIIMADKLGRPKTTVDWTFDRLSCDVGESINITMTNLNGDYEFEGGIEMFHIETQDGKQVGDSFAIPVNPAKPKGEDFFSMKEWGCYTWPWSTATVSPGVYRLVPYRHTGNGPVPNPPLKKRVTVRAKLSA